MNTQPVSRRLLLIVLAAAALGLAHLAALLGTNPLADPDDQFGQSMLFAAGPVADAALLVAALGLTTSALALWSGRRSRRRTAVAVTGAVPAILLLDHSIIMILGYLPALLVILLMGRTEHLVQVVTVGTALQTVTLAAVVAVLLSLRGGRGGTGDDLEAATRATRRWTKIAIEAPLAYALTRVLMFVKAPGFRSETFDDLTLWAGLGLGAAAVVGAVLTWGLIAPWGERFPRWMVGLAGRRVPIGLAVVPALAVAAMVLAASRTIAIQGVTDRSDLLDGATELPLVVLPHLLWPLWAVALAVATLSYRRRRALTHEALTPTGA
ncbi:hypothetical protein [Aeromicrobium sp. CTD01-1L150]|uniref:hypothetical protein n=1 Tax=Aeromicrobium sp. CTD01-1L150 TaxID=3341830 RepID=UPI0035C158C0